MSRYDLILSPNQTLSAVALFIVEENHSLVVVTKPSFGLLSVQLSTCSATDVRKNTDDWVLSEGKDHDELGSIVDTLEKAGLCTEGLNEVVMKA